MRLKKFAQKILMALLALSLSLVFVPGGFATQTPIYASNWVRVDPLIIQALQHNQGEARVLVALRAPTSEQGIWAQSLQIAQTQNVVLQDIAGEDFVVTYRYQTVPGLAGSVTEQGLEELREHPDVRAIALDMQVHAATLESAVQIGADQVWAEYSLTGSGVNVAVLDSGIDVSHPDLADHIVAQHCFVQAGCGAERASEGDSAQDVYGHGTQVAGIITGKGSASPQGIAPDAGIVAVRVLDEQGNGWTSDVVAAIDWVTSNQWQYDVRLINLSLGGGEYRGVCDEADANTMLLAKAIASARLAGIATFAASGNGGARDALNAPACLTQAIAVGSVYDADLGPRDWVGCTDASSAEDQVTCFSNSSAALDLLAPGAWIESTALGGGQRGAAGTSMAVPHAVAVAALMLQTNPYLTPGDLEATLKDTGVPIQDSRNAYTVARVDALAAVQAVAPPPVQPSPAPPSVVTPTYIISGTVLLQGRADHSGTVVTLSEATCDIAAQDTANPDRPLAYTDANGHFALAVVPDHAYQCLSIQHARYLFGQSALPLSKQRTLVLAAGDLTGDGLINIYDLTRIAARYGTSDVEADLNGDGLVNIYDLTIVAGNYGKIGPVMEWQ